MWRYRLFVFFPMRIFRGYQDSDDASTAKSRLADVQHTADLCSFWGYGLEEYAVPTKDGYLEYEIIFQPLF
jgi:hypothetical protein